MVIVKSGQFVLRLLTRKRLSDHSEDSGRLIKASKKKPIMKASGPLVWAGHRGQRFQKRKGRGWKGRRQGWGAIDQKSANLSFVAKKNRTGRGKGRINRGREGALEQHGEVKENPPVRGL